MWSTAILRLQSPIRLFCWPPGVSNIPKTKRGWGWGYTIKLQSNYTIKLLPKK